MSVSSSLLKSPYAAGMASLTPPNAICVISDDDTRAAVKVSKTTRKLDDFIVS